jgi:hypothetical protein
MPATLRGLFQGIAYALPQMAEMIQNQQYYDIQNQRNILEREKFDFEKLQYEEAEPMRAEMLKKLEYESKEAARLFDINEEFGRDIAELEKRMLQLQVIGQNKNNQYTQAQIDEAKQSLAERIAMFGANLDRVIAETENIQANTSLMSVQKMAEILKMNLKTAGLFTMFADNEKMLDTIINAESIKDLAKGIQGLDIKPHQKAYLLDVTDQLVNLEYNNEQAIAEFTTSVYAANAKSKNPMKKKEVDEIVEQFATSRRAMTRDLAKNFWDITWGREGPNSFGVTGDFRKSFSEKVFNANELVDRGFGSDIRAAANYGRAAIGTMQQVPGIVRKAGVAGLGLYGDYVKKQTDMANKYLNPFNAPRSPYEE